MLLSRSLRAATTASRHGIKQPWTVASAVNVPLPPVPSSVATSSSFVSFSTSSSNSGLDTVAVCGLGLMGHGIAQVAAACGAHSKVIAYEPQENFLQTGKDRIAASLGKLVKKEKLSQDQMDTILQQTLHFTTNMDDLASADLVVEAVIENLDLKKNLYEQLDTICQPSCILASNTSSLPIKDMAAFTKRPANVCGIHFFNPVQLMKLVEIIHTDDTDPAIIDKVTKVRGWGITVYSVEAQGKLQVILTYLILLSFCYLASKWVNDDLRKVSVHCGDTPGFIVNRLLVPSLMQAMLMVDRQDATVADIDVSLQLGAGHPMGPLHLADYIGLDTCYYIVQGWVEKYPNEPAFVIPQCLKAKVEAGDLGRKSGKGFYHWDKDKRLDPVE